MLKVSCVSQAMMPFTQEELAYIQRLDAAADVALLQQQLPSLRVESLRTLQVQILPFQGIASSACDQTPWLCWRGSQATSVPAQWFTC